MNKETRIFAGDLVDLVTIHIQKWRKKLKGMSRPSYAAEAIESKIEAAVEIRDAMRALAEQERTE